MQYSLIAEGSKVVAIWSAKVNGTQADGVQAFRVEHGKLVETWFSGTSADSKWGADAYTNLDTVRVPN